MLGAGAVARIIRRVAHQTVRPGACPTRWQLAALGSRQLHGTRPLKHDLVVPELGDSITEGTIVEWTKAEGDYVEVDDIICVIETDKVSVDIRSDTAGLVTQLLVPIEEAVEVGAAIAKLDTDAPKPEGAAAPAAAVAPEPAPAVTPAAAAPAAPAAPAAAAPKPAAPSTPSAPTATPAPSGTRDETRVPMSRMRLRIAERLKDAQNTAACLTTFNEIDMSGIMNVRKQYKDAFQEKHGVKLGFMSVFVKAATAALLKHPAVNASIDDKDIVYRDYVDISFAAATPTGLVVPVLRNTEMMGFAEVEKEVGRLGAKAREGKIALEDMMGGNFTISNGGVFGSQFGTPILNPPQTAVLGMHGTFKRPVVVNDEIVIRPMMYVALTYDHRLIDGSDAVLFLRKIKEGVEDPTTLLLDL